MFKLLDEIMGTSVGLLYTGGLMMFFGTIALLASLSVSFFGLTFILTATVFLGLIMMVLGFMGVGE
tara:strand:- start:21 stop:218 length:198 start_codon:yes stop_codon:yes gene_type:complete